MRIHRITVVVVLPTRAADRSTTLSAFELESEGARPSRVLSAAHSAATNMRGLT